MRDRRYTGTPRSSQAFVPSGCNTESPPSKGMSSSLAQVRHPERRSLAAAWLHTIQSGGRACTCLLARRVDSDNSNAIVGPRNRDVGAGWLSTFDGGS